jgi:hypothetical protein
MRCATLAVLFGAAVLANGAWAVQPDPAYLEAKGGDGCWVHFFDGREFEGSMGRLAGALYMNSVMGPGLVGTLATKEYLRRAESLVVAPPRSSSPTPSPASGRSS